MKRFFRSAIFLAAFLIFVTCTAGDSYRVIFLGDTHYDAEDARLHPEGISKARERDTEMWKERLPKLLTAANKKATESKTAFVLQGGDMVEGGGGTADAHWNMLVDGYKCLQSYFSVPFLTVAGNHDVSSRVQKGEKGAFQIYQDFATQHVLPAIQKLDGVSNIQVSPSKMDFAFRYKQDLYLLLNFNGAGTRLDFLQKVLEENADARHKIITTHAGPIPWDVRWMPNWRFYGQCALERRDAALDLFQKHNCIVLSGHYHGISALEYTTEKGTIHQIQNCSVWTPNIMEVFEPISKSAEKYGTNLLKSRYIKPEQQQELINRFKPGLKYYTYGGGAGYMTLEISDDKVVVNYYHRDSDTISYTYTIPKK